ncbi:Glycosyltransferase, catalytic subunit of cellulose synthase and poly-beta-1,6-N-acetylglucosamine synthase [Devosia crocina]|uniref:Glycosyltransferase, catalytic subunit of cellulose synthase and poly-beta-1,6-N-acetylglucosamine synthase n=1 Tax=Devosia crocina TaxID=429728 RepID=A0A1I7NUI3_9HYPH|nr:glycosyltransferase [Devosia crocina]SFV38283.1 Glycosyltransferase, catalytic subunit of cellulose synthase and poly-beta-1,6-N-acetylglucosamine synthase [Devosia crocina]
MHRALPLMRAIMEEAGCDGGAEQLLEEALLGEIDPLVHAANRLGVGMDTVLARAAAHLDLVFFESIPPSNDLEVPRRLEHLGTIQMLRVRTIDRDVAYMAPDFFGLLRLGAMRGHDSDIRRRICIVSMATMRAHLAQVASPALIEGARHAISRNWAFAAAHLDLTLLVRIGFIVGLAMAVALLLVMPYVAPVWLVPIWAGLMLLPTGLRLASVLSPPPRPCRAVARDDETGLPLYSILVPLRDEAGMVDQLCYGLRRLDYPWHRLEIIFVVEQRSAETVAALRRHREFPAFSVIEVPHAMPLTKPKALDFALPFCRGEFVVVYDAEDRPEPDQLRRVLGQFRRAPHLHCIQSRLVISNGDRGVFPSLFAGEYAGLFSVFLPALARWGVVMPLGGTSNHFRLASLRTIGGWDAYNVTEDADLGVRLARRGIACGTSSTVTYEDAPELFRVWLGQRRRWMKGWMQTFLVHNRHPGTLLRDLGWWRFAAFQVIVLSMVLSPLLHTCFLLAALVFLAMGGVPLPVLDLWSATCVFVLLAGHGVAILSNTVGLMRSGQAGLALWQVLLPFYWLAIAWATLLALYDLATRPHHWIKTSHVPSFKKTKAYPIVRRLLPRWRQS